MAVVKLKRLQKESLSGCVTACGRLKRYRQSLRCRKKGERKSLYRHRLSSLGALYGSDIWVWSFWDRGGTDRFDFPCPRSVGCRKLGCRFDTFECVWCRFESRPKSPASRCFCRKWICITSRYSSHSHPSPSCLSAPAPSPVCPAPS